MTVPALPSALSAVPTAAAVGVPCATVVVEIVAVPAAWLTAAMPSLAGAAGMRCRPFTARVLAMRVPWLAAALSASVPAARSLAGIGHAAGIAGIAASAVVVAGLLAARHQPGVMRALAGQGSRTDRC